jgi:hypothetical protein
MITMTEATRAARVAAWVEGLPVKPCEQALWGRDGWDTPEWPYARFYAWREGDAVCVASNFEGDVTKARFAGVDAGERAAAWVDENVHFGWGRGYATPKGFDAADPAEAHTGPFVWALISEAVTR